MKTKITTLLGIESPVVQGGMAWVAESHLAAAVRMPEGLGSSEQPVRLPSGCALRFRK